MNHNFEQSIPNVARINNSSVFKYNIFSNNIKMAFEYIIINDGMIFKYSHQTFNNYSNKGIFQYFIYLIFVQTALEDTQGRCVPKSVLRREPVKIMFSNGFTNAFQLLTNYVNV